MRKLGLSGWAQIAEIVASVAVVISLLFVAFSIKRNTQEIHAANINFMYELDAQVTTDLSRDAGLAAVQVKFANNEPLSEVEQFQYLHLQQRYLTVWEIAWTHHQSGSLSQSEWDDWDQYYAHHVKTQFPLAWWEEIRSSYRAEFAEHVNAVYEGN